MNTATIFGGGFGLYGYLSALKEIGFSRFIINKRHKEMMQNHKRLSAYVTYCIFADDIEMISLISDLVVVAVYPRQQGDLVRSLSISNPTRPLLLEKPLGVDPAESEDLVRFLKLNHIKFNCNYIFLYTTWFQKILKQHSEYRSIRIEWSFRAHHFLNDVDTWKRVPSEGGGVIRYYGIHLIYIASVIGFFSVTSSKVIVDTSGEELSWECTLQDASGRQLLIYLHTCSPDQVFSISCDENSIVNLYDPFDMDEPKISNLDRRHDLIKKHILFSLGNALGTKYADELEAILLWKNIELRHYFTSK